MKEQVLVEYSFIGGSLDGHRIQVPHGDKTYRVPKPFTLSASHPTDETTPSTFELEVETYHYDYNRHCFIEESVASAETIEWSKYQMTQAVGEWIKSEDPKVFEVQKRYLEERFERSISAHILELSQTIGIDLNVIAYLMGELKKKEAMIDALENKNEEMTNSFTDLISYITSIQGRKIK